MRAVDTNVLVRLMIGDDPVQSERARQLFEAERIYIPTSVLLETEWVLRRGYRLVKRRVIAELRQLAGLQQVRVQDPPLLSRALTWADAGMDFADALHLAAVDDCTDFVSFDRSLARRAAALDAVPVNEP